MADMTITNLSPPRHRRIAVSGSQAWPAEWRPVIWRDLDDQLLKLRAGDIFYLRWGMAKPDGQNGADYAAELWLNERIGQAGGITILREPVPADWDKCVTEPGLDVWGNKVDPCPEKVNGRPHRRPSQRSTAPDGCICPSAGHRRNPDIVAHPDHPVSLLLAYCVDDSPGTTATVGYARRSRVHHELKAFYTLR